MQREFDVLNGDVAHAVITRDGDVLNTLSQLPRVCDQLPRGARMSRLIDLAATNGRRVGGVEMDDHFSERVRGVHADYPDHDGARGRGEGWGLDVKHPGNYLATPILSDDDEIGSSDCEVAVTDVNRTATCMQKPRYINFVIKCC